MGGERIKLRILIPLTIAIVGLLGAFITGAFRLKQNALDSQIRQYLTSVKRVLRSTHHVEVESLGKMLDNLQLNEPLRQAYANGNRSGFLTAAKPVFHELCRNHDINDLHYYDIHGSVFAEFNEKAASSVSFEHTTLARAMTSGEPFFGMEVSSAGSFFLSYTVPWKIKGQTIGFIEIEKELKHITKDVPKAFGVELITFIDKQYVTRELWESIYQRQYRGVTWESCLDYVVIDNTFDELPPTLKNTLSGSFGENPGASAELVYQDSEYSIVYFSLIDVHNRTVGYSAVFYDATNYLQETRDLLYLISALCLAIGLALFISFYKMLDSLEQELSESRQTILEENQLRLEIERRHTKELAAHVLELEIARTRELNMAREAELARTSAEEVRQKLRDSRQQTSP